MSYRKQLSITSDFTGIDVFWLYLLCCAVWCFQYIDSVYMHVSCAQFSKSYKHDSFLLFTGTDKLQKIHTICSNATHFNQKLMLNI